MVSFSEKEINGNALIEKSAELLNAHFFIDSGEGRDLETDTIYLMDLSGWLIPNERKDEFISSNRKDKRWDSFYMFAEWRNESDGIKIDFKRYPQYEV